MAEKNQEHVYEGILEKIVYQDDSSGWGVARIAVTQHHEAITVTGMVYGLHEGERIRIQGRWENKGSYGDQFRMDACTPLKPDTLSGLREYLCSGFIKGVGRETATRLIDAFGMEVITIIENTPEVLMKIPGIGKRKARIIQAAWRKHHEMSDSMILLQSLEVSAAYAYKIFKFYGGNAYRVLQENPYRLCYEIPGVGFKTADRIALKFGISRQSPFRIRAGILYTLGEICERGHVCYPDTLLRKSASFILGLPVPVISDTLEKMILDNELSVDEMAPDRLVFLNALHEAERETALYLKSLAGTAINKRVPALSKAVEWFERSNGISLAKEQRQALEGALSEKILVITGGPGTGKTTLIKGIIDICERRGIDVELCAPTGRAAKRMSEAANREAKTIHRLFEISSTDQPAYAEGRTLKTDKLIIDEVSMVDTMLFLRVLKGISTHTCLILVGDSDQLPSVGPGNVLGDIIRSGCVKTIRLTEIFRQSRESLIISNAHRINQGLMPLDAGDAGESDFFFIQREEPGEALEVIKELVSHRIPRRFGFYPLRDIQVLSPMHKGILGVENLNKELQSLLNPDGREIFVGSRRFREGDKVMQLKNDYERAVFNGDLGVVVFVDQEKKAMEVEFEGAIARYEVPDMENLSVAYACSIHKSQGNEFPAVVLALHSQHGIMLQRNLLYTAVTRGKSLVILVGNTKAVGLATSNVRRSQRHTLLAQRLKGMV